MKLKFISPALLSFTFSAFCLLSSTSSSAQVSKGTLRVMAYNTLDFNGCQGEATATIYAELRDIIQFANPDIAGLDKLQCVQTSATDNNGLSSYTFPDSVISECFNSNFSYCPFTDASDCNDGNSSILFYNHNKIGYLSTTVLYSGQEDIDLYKFYYNQWFSGSTDTTFLYVVLCHTISGSASAGRDNQDSTVMNKVRAMFPHTPNLIYMGDFNTRNSSEPGYAYITQTSDTNYVMDDPSFYPDGHLSYPDDWSSSNTDQAYFTTSTRTSTLPNSCGTTGGAKDWYDHIFLSPYIVNGTNNLTYVRDSYKTIGNNGNRAGLNVNDSVTYGFNTSAPDDVIDALFNFSDKYPIEVTLAVNPILGTKNIQSNPGSIKVNNPVENSLVIHFDSFLNGQIVAMGVYDVCGRLINQATFNVTNSIISKDISLTPGVYFIHFTSGGYSTVSKVVKE
jgi:hypothetical protein